jgi:hypothetical protein
VDFRGFGPNGCHTPQSNAACRVGGAAGTRFVGRLDGTVMTATVIALLLATFAATLASILQIHSGFELAEMAWWTTNK